jgi:phospholipase/carboxylesterase
LRAIRGTTTSLLVTKTNGSRQSRTRCSRRSALGLGLGSLLSACRSQTSHGGDDTKPLPATGASSVGATSTELRLDTVTISKRAESERGGVAVVLLHGFGAAGDDLVSLAEHLARPGSRFFVPAAPLAQGGSGRAWWYFDQDRPPHAWDERLPEGFHPHPQVARVRRAVQQLLRDVRARYAPERLVLGGFSQGAMLSLDVALQANPPVDRVAVLSGVLLAESLSALQAARDPKPRVFVSHGRQDPVLPFAAADSARRMLEHHGYAVQFQPFEGRHQIPDEVVAALADFIYDGA